MRRGRLDSWLSLATFGESRHNNHHAFPTSAFHGLRPHEIDIGGHSRSALQNAASIAKNILTTEAIVAEPPEKEAVGAADDRRGPPGV